MSGSYGIRIGDMDVAGIEARTPEGAVEALADHLADRIRAATTEEARQRLLEDLRDTYGEPMAETARAIWSNRKR